MGTTGPVICAGEGLVPGTPCGSPLTSAGLPPTVASTAPVAAPATASRQTTTGTRCLGLAARLGPAGYDPSPKAAYGVSKRVHRLPTYVPRQPPA